MVADFPPLHLLDEGGHLHAVAAVSSLRLPRVGEPLDRAVVSLAFGPERAARGNPPPYFLLHPPAYYALAAPAFAAGGGDWQRGLRLARLTSVALLLTTAVAVPLLLLGESRRLGRADPLDAHAGALVASLPLLAPGVAFGAAFVTNHAADVAFGELLGVATAGALARAAVPGAGRAMRRWLLAAALLAGLLAANRASNAWAIAVPLALMLAAGEGRGRSLAVAIVGLAPGALLLVAWLASNLAATGVAVPSRLADALQVRLVGSVARAGRASWQAVAMELLLGQGRAVGPSDRGVLLLLEGGLGLALAWYAWLAARTWREESWAREPGGTPRSRLARVALAAAAFGPGALAANAVLLALASGAMSGSFQPLGRYFLAPLCFCVALIGGWTALGGPARWHDAGPPRPVDRESLASGSRGRGSFARAALAAALALALASVWRLPGRFTPPRWGTGEAHGVTPLAAVFGLPG